jgi:hypothetical protein
VCVDVEERVKMWVKECDIVCVSLTDCESEHVDECIGVIVLEIVWEVVWEYVLEREDDDVWVNVMEINRE